MKAMKYKKVGFIILVCVLTGSFLAGLLWARAYAAGSEYPTRAITMVVPFPAGGANDLSARALAEALEKHLKHPVVVVNKVGGATTVGGYAVASAKPDGYTLGYFNPAPAIPEAYAYFQEAPYTSKDIRPISGIAGVVLMIAVKEDAPWNSLKELVQYAQKNPGIKVSTGGKHTLMHMFVTTLNKVEKTGFVAVPFTGDATSLPNLLGGHVTVGILTYSALKPLVDANKLKLLAVVCPEKRVDFAPSVPTAVELGYPVVFSPSLFGVFGPRGIPEEIVEKIDGLVAKIVTEQDFQTKMRNMTLQIDYRNSAGHERYLAKLKDDILAFFKGEGLIK